MAAGVQFPAFLRIQADDAAGEFAKIGRDAEAASRKMRSAFEQDASAIQRTLQKALNVPPGAGGSFDLQAKGLAESAARAEALAGKLRMVATASATAAAQTGDASVATQRYSAFTAEAAKQAELVARAARDEANAMERLQQELAALPAAHAGAKTAAEAQARALQAVNGSAGANRFAISQLGQQFGDLGIQLANNARPLQAISQQFSQAAFILGTMGGSASKVGAFFAGPWGTALSLGLIATDLLTRGLFDNAKASETASNAADSFGRAQSLLGQLIDLSTGALRNQNVVLRESIALQARRGIIEGQRAEREQAAALKKVGQPSFFESLGSLAPALGGAVVPGEQLAERRRLEARFSPLQDLVTKFSAGGFATKSDPTGTEAAIKQLDRLAAAGRLAGRDVLDLRENLIKLGTARNDQRANQQILDVLAGKGIPAELRPYEKPTKPKSTGAAAARLEEFGEDAGKRLQRFVTQFSDAPPAIAKVTTQLAELDDIADDIERRRPPNYAALKKQVEEARAAIRTGLTEPFREYQRDAERAAEIQALTNAGRTTEATILGEALRLQERMGRLSSDQLGVVVDTVTARERENEALARAQAQQQKYLSALQDVRGTIQDTVAGLRTDPRGAIGGLVQGIGATYDRLFSSVVTDKLFGASFEELERTITGRKSPLDIAAEQSGRIVSDLNDRLAKFASTVDTATLALGGTAGGPRPIANDNAIAAAEKLAGKLGATVTPTLGAITGTLGSAAKAIEAAAGKAGGGDAIVVTGQRQRFDGSPGGFLGSVVGKLVTGLTKREGESARDAAKRNEELVDKIGGIGRTVAEGVTGGQIAGGLVLGRGGDSTGSAIGGVLGKVAGDALGKTVGTALGSLGSALGPLGSIAGGVLGGLVGGLFGGGPKASGTATLTGVDTRALTTGTSGDTRNAASSLATSVQSGLQRIADQLGGTVGAFDTVLGVYDGKYRVRSSAMGWNGQGGLNFRGSSAQGLTDFGEDEAAAIRFAILDALQDGAIAGIREGTKRLLQAGSDLDRALQKALDFEGVFRDLRKREDPLGAALDELNSRFTQLRKTFTEAGASVEERTQLERLYGLERADAIKDATEAMTGSLRGLLKDLEGDSGRSVRDRLAVARATYDPLAAAVGAGQKVDFDAFADATRDVVGLMRELYGSGGGYFDFLDGATELTKKALAGQEVLLNAATSGDTPFSGTGSAGADGSRAVVSAVDKQTDAIVAALRGELGAVNDNLGTLIQQNRSAAASGGSGSPLDRSNRQNF